MDFINKHNTLGLYSEQAAESNHQVVRQYSLRYKNVKEGKKALQMNKAINVEKIAKKQLNL